MRAITLCLFFVLAFAFTLGQNFQGVWKLDQPDVISESFIYICVNSDERATGLFNEQTIFIGYVNDNTFSGNFYEGYYDGGCTTGTFEFTINSKTRTFSGSFICEDDGSLVDWSATQVSNSKPTDVECANVAEFNTFTVAGFYIGTNTGSANADVCVYDNDFYEASYSDGSFDYGTSVLEGRIIYGIKGKPNGDGVLPGSSLSYVDVNGDLHNLFWAGVAIEFTRSSVYLNNSQVHQYDSYSFVQGTNDFNCNRNNQLVVAEPNYYFDPVYFYYYYITTNTSSSLAISLLLILCAFGFML